MNDVETIRFLWRYMAHADVQVMAAAQTVSDQDYWREQNISFGSIEKLLNHEMLAQRTHLSPGTAQLDDQAGRRKTVNSDAVFVRCRTGHWKGGLIEPIIMVSLAACVTPTRPGGPGRAYCLPPPHLHIVGTIRRREASSRSRPRRLEA